MILIRDIRDYIATLKIADDENCYCGIMPNKKDKSIGTYSLKSGRQPNIPIGGIHNSSYGTKSVSFLVHWNKLPTETEKAADRLYNALQNTKQAEVNGYIIKFIQMNQNEPASVGTDDKGIFEYVIECLIYYDEKERNEENASEKRCKSGQ